MTELALVKIENQLTSIKPDRLKMLDNLHEMVQLINARELEAIKERLKEIEDVFNSGGHRYCVCFQLTVTVLK